LIQAAIQFEEKQREELRQKALERKNGKKKLNSKLKTEPKIKKGKLNYNSKYYKIN